MEMACRRAVYLRCSLGLALVSVVSFPSVAVASECPSGDSTLPVSGLCASW